MNVTDGIRSAIPATRFARFDDAWRRLALDGAGSAEGGSFGATLAGALSRVSETQDVAAAYAAAFARGENVELHQVMASAEEAGIALELLVELRNKVLDAYHSLANMQG